MSTAMLFQLQIDKKQQLKRTNENKLHNARRRRNQSQRRRLRHQALIVLGHVLPTILNKRNRVGGPRAIIVCIIAVVRVLPQWARRDGIGQSGSSRTINDRSGITRERRAALGLHRFFDKACFRTSGRQLSQPDAKTRQLGRAPKHSVA